MHPEMRVLSPGSLCLILAGVLAVGRVADTKFQDRLLPLEKRLSELAEAPDPADDCPTMRLKNETIIRTAESLRNGAEFLASPEDVYSTDGCIQRCCSDARCNTAISKSKKGLRTACYLFDCGYPNVCLFSRNKEFSVTQFMTTGTRRRPQPPNDEIESNGDMEEDKEREQNGGDNVEPDLDEKDSAEAVPQTTTSFIPAKGQKTTKPSYVLLHDKCRFDSDCSVEHSSCTDSRCRCAQGYHIVGLQCRLDCSSEFEFECINLDAPAFRQCIAVYDRCDTRGIIHCKDGSDEIGCERGSNPLVTRLSIKASPTVPVIHRADLDITSTKSKDVDDNSSIVKVPGDDGWSLPLSRGALIALVLSVVITLGLLICVIYRIRQVRGGYKKSFLVDSSDADYLVNGMYL